MVVVTIADGALLSVEQQIYCLEKGGSSLKDTGVEKIRKLLKREYSRKAISTFQFLDLAKRVNVLAGRH